MHTYFLRLRPGEDLKASLDAWALAEGVDAAAILCGIGSLSTVAIRFANKPEADLRKEDLEIISLQGTLSRHGSHIHIAVSDAHGHVTGGHLKEGSIVRTTAEIALCLSDLWTLLRHKDDETGYDELFVERKDD